MKKILMTGATGFLGSNLLKSLLKDEHKITILKRSFSKIERIRDEIKEVSIFDIDKTPIDKLFSKGSFDIILHCATDYGRKNTDPLMITDANLMLPLKLLEIGIKNKVPCFINTDTLLDKRVNHYSLSKKQFKEWLNSYSRELICVNIAIEHFFGPFDDKTKFVSFVIDKIISNAPEVQLTKGEQKRDFIYIDDVVDAFIKIIGNIDGLEKGFYAYEIGSNEQIAIKALIEMIKQLSRNNMTKLNFGALPYRENEVMESNVNTKAVRALGWSPRYSLKEGLKKTIEAEIKARKQ